LSAAEGPRSRRNAAGRTKSGKPRPGTGGQGRRKLEGKGPTPPAAQRPGHPAQKRASGSGSRRSSDAPGSGSGSGSRRSGDAPGSGSGSGSRRSADASGYGSGSRRSADASGYGSGSRRSADASGYGSGSGSRRFADGSGYGSAPSSGGARRSPRGAGDAAEFVAGRNPVVESLRARVPATTLYVGARVARDDRVDEAIKLAADRGVPVLEAGPAELDRLTGGALHQGLALRVRAYDYAHPDDLLARAADAGQLPLIAALDGVTDPRNLGAIVRSAAAFGAHGVVVPSRRGAGVTAGAWKASAGALARLPVARAANLARALQSYRDAGVFVAGLDAAGEATIRDLDLATAPLVLVTGSEGRGMSRIVAQTCDVLVRIPIAASTESLNAGVAAGIALYEVAAVRSRLRLRCLAGVAQQAEQPSCKRQVSGSNPLTGSSSEGVRALSDHLPWDESWDECRSSASCASPVDAGHLGSGSWATVCGRGSGSWATVVRGH
jgi:23S rRNA (guanosine2251-2'-O)-methyltransferase